MRRLALLVTDAGAPVERGELGDAAARAAAAASRIVREEEGRVDFGLPLLTQWFAADALVAGDPRVTELASSPPRLGRWRYALAIALATGPRQFVDEAMATLVAAEPAFTAEIVEESFERWAMRDEPVTAQRSATEVGSALRSAVMTWGDAIEPLTRLLLPRDATGDLLPLGVRVDSGRYLTLGWYRGDRHVADVSELPANANVLRSPAEWAVRRSGVWGDERGWAWRWSLELLREDLKRELATLSLRTDDVALLDEALWLVALEAAGRGSLSHEPIAIETVEAGLAGIDPSRPLIRLRDRYAHTEQILARFNELRESGLTEISSPWPTPDEPDTRAGAGWIWDPYSAEQQRRRVEAVYRAALRAYASLVDEWFPRLKR